MKKLKYMLSIFIIGVIWFINFWSCDFSWSFMLSVQSLGSLNVISWGVGIPNFQSFYPPEHYLIDVLEPECSFEYSIECNGLRYSWSSSLSWMLYIGISEMPRYMSFPIYWDKRTFSITWSMSWTYYNSWLYKLFIPLYRYVYQNAAAWGQIQWLCFYNLESSCIQLSDISWSSSSCPDCPSCDDPYTSLECQNEYNLIPIENVTKEYCEINHNLISPESCPICEWSGSINWSALYINNEQVSSASRINVNIDDWIDYNLNYVEDSATINVTGPEWDQEYIQWIIDTNSYQPSTEDFKNVFVWWLTLILPYLVVVLFVVFIWKFIRKIFK